MLIGGTPSLRYLAQIVCILLIGGTPSLRDLWLPAPQALPTQEQTALQWQTFQCLMMSQIPISDLQKIPARYIGLVSVLHFLIQQQPHSIMYEMEVDAFLAVAVSRTLEDPSALAMLRVCVPLLYYLHLRTRKYEPPFSVTEL